MGQLGNLPGDGASVVILFVEVYFGVDIVRVQQQVGFGIRDHQALKALRFVGQAVLPYFALPEDTPLEQHP
jgi:hypothetical protein